MFTGTLGHCRFSYILFAWTFQLFPFIRSKPRSLAATLLSVLRKKLATKLPSASGSEMPTGDPQSESSTEPELRTISGYYGGVENHGQRGIETLGGIREGESLEFRPISPATSDYVSVCSDSGQISVGSRRTTPPLNPTNHDLPPHPGDFPCEDSQVFFGETPLPSPEDETDPSIGDYFRVSSAYLMNRRNQATHDVTSDDYVTRIDLDNDSSGIETNSINQEQAVAARDIRRNSSKSRKNRKRDRSSSGNRLKNLNTENFIVYVWFHFFLVQLILIIFYCIFNSSTNTRFTWKRLLITFSIVFLVLCF